MPPANQTTKKLIEIFYGMCVSKGFILNISKCIYYFLEGDILQTFLFTSVSVYYISHTCMYSDQTPDSFSETQIDIIEHKISGRIEKYEVDKPQK